MTTLHWDGPKIDPVELLALWEVLEVMGTPAFPPRNTFMLGCKAWHSPLIREDRRPPPPPGPPAATSSPVLMGIFAGRTHAGMPAIVTLRQISTAIEYEAKFGSGPGIPGGGRGPGGGSL